MERYRTTLSTQHSGFTLIELMIVLVIAAILVTVAAPSMSNFIANNRVSTSTNELVTALNLARNEAIRTNQNAVLCKSSDGATCSNAANWADGWLVFIDSDNDNTWDAGERVVVVHGATNSSLDFNLATSNGVEGNAISFKPRGYIDVVNVDESTTTNIRFCFGNSSNPSNSRAVIFNRTGRFITEKRSSTNNCAAA